MKAFARGERAHLPRVRSSACAWLAVLVAAVLLSAGACVRRSSLPEALTDQEFWSAVEAFSEPPGQFPLSDNLVSNEAHFADTIRWFRPSGGVYVGVGPEQNFSYIAGLRPSIAFVIDIRRENLALHLLYKALFELSPDRVDFISRLFSRSRPPGLGSTSSVEEIFGQFDGVPPSLDVLSRNAVLVRERLMTTRGMPLPASDLAWIDRVLGAFHDSGPAIDYYGDLPVDTVRPSYRELMVAKDIGGRPRSFLATEESYRFIKELHTRNLIVPVVGNFGGPRAFRAVADYVRARAGRVSAVYASNVGGYLTSQQAHAFCGNLVALPIAASAWFIESNGMRPLRSKLRSCASETK
jgi:hypothetical protein